MVRPPPVTDDLERAAAWWDSHNEHYSSTGANEWRANWKLHPSVMRNFEVLLGNQTSGQWLAAQIRDPLPRAMSIGCGIARFEIELLVQGTIEHCDLWDISVAALEEAAGNAEQAGVADRVSLHRGDALESSERGYDLMIFQDSLHHATDLEATLGFTRSALRSGGWVFAEEYIGPSRFAFPPHDVDLAQRLYRMLADDLRCQWPELPLPDPAAVAEADPTEAVESDRILESLSEFGECRTVLFGGALPYILWHGLDHDALWDTQRGRELVDVLLDLDRALTESQMLPSYFGVILARDPSHPGR